MSDNGEPTSVQRGLPGSINGLLRLLIGKKVTIVLESGEREIVVVERVSGNLLVARIEKECECFKFVDIKCICEVLVECKELLESILNGNFLDNSCSDDRSFSSSNTDPVYGWRLYNKK